MPLTDSINKLFVAVSHRQVVVIRKGCHYESKGVCEKNK